MTVRSTALVARHLRSRSGGLTVALLVLVLSLVAVLAPVALGALSDTAMRDRLSSLGPLARDVATTVPGIPQAATRLSGAATTTDEVWGEFLEGVEAIRSGADEPLPPLLGPARAVARSVELPLVETPRTGRVTLAFDPSYVDEVRLVDGRAPAPAAAADAQADGTTLQTVEIALSVASADEIGWALGDARTTEFRQNRTRLVLVGTFEPIADDDGYWEHVPSARQPEIFDDGNAPRRVTVTGFADPASLPVALTQPGRAETTVWFPFDTSSVDASTAARTASALRKLTADAHPVGSPGEGAGVVSLRFSADASATIERALAQQAATTGLIAMIVSGPIGVAVAVLVLGCRLVLERRRSALRLLSARGAAPGQLRFLLGLEGLMLGLAPALLGAGIGIAIALRASGSPPAPGVIAAAVLLGFAPPGVLAALAGSAAERPARTDLGRRGPRIRLVAEGIVAVLAAAAVTLLFLRGAGGPGAQGLDVLQAATPLLLAVVACVITLRLYPLPLARVLESARRSPGLHSFLGAARGLREPTIGLTPVLALVVGVSVAVSSGVLLSSLQEGVTRAAQAQVGSDLRITGGAFSPAQLESVRTMAGVAAATGISGPETATLEVNGQTRLTTVYVVDAADMRVVQGDQPGLLPPGVELPAGDSPVPVVAASAIAERIGSAGDARLNAVAVTVAGVSSGPSPIGERQDRVVIDSSYAEDVLGGDREDRTVLLRLDASASVADVADAVVDLLGDGIRIESVDRIVGGIQSSPSVQGVRIALLAATALAALLSALAIVMTLTLAARPRARVLALLRTLGAPPGSSTSLALWEIGPPAVAAVIAGTVFGAIVPLVVLAGVDLRPFTGSSVQPGYHVDAATLGVMLGGFVMLAAVFTAVALWMSRRARAASALRTVEEG